MTNRLGYFTLDTPDVAKARVFYATLFGWTFDEGSSHPGYAHVALDGHAGPDFGIRQGEGKTFAHLYFKVTDIRAMCDRVVELGGQAAIPAESASGLSAVVCDDQGVSFGLWQPA